MLPSPSKRGTSTLTRVLQSRFCLSQLQEQLPKMGERRKGEESPGASPTALQPNWGISQTLLSHPKTQSWEKSHGAGGQRDPPPLSPLPHGHPPAPYLLLLLLRHQVSVAVHSLLRLVLIPAALLIEPPGLGEPPDRAGAGQQATRCQRSSGRRLRSKAQPTRRAQAASRAGDGTQGPGCPTAGAKATSQDKLLFV